MIQVFYRVFIYLPW